MSSKLDQSLEEITGGRRNDRRPRRGGKPRVSTGGITKTTAPTKPAKGQARPVKAAAVAAAAVTPRTAGDSKIVVSNLPFDILESQIKDYFVKEVGPVKKVILNYNKNGRSLGVATVIFSQAQSAAKAAKNINGIPVDGKPLKVEVVVDAQSVPTPVAPKSLNERIQKPKKEANKPKSAAAGPKPATTPAGGAGAAGKGRAKKGRANRPKPKTVEELDAEMSEYFDPNAAAGAGAAAPTNGTAAPVVAAPAGGDANMEDEIM